MTRINDQSGETSAKEILAAWVVTVTLALAALASSIL